jgi:hypothetical protein
MDASAPLIHLFELDTTTDSFVGPKAHQTVSVQPSGFS